MTKKTVVIGGGASGLIAAYFSAAFSETVIIEKNEKLGKKIYITGKGRCNVTNDCDVEEFLSNVVTNPKFLISAINAFPPEKLTSLLEENGLRLKTERGNRVFPLSDKSSDVIKTLVKMCDGAGVITRLNEKVLKIVTENGSVKSVVTDKGEIKADRVIVATGGASYPLTGSTGDGYAFAESVGHTVTPVTSALSGILAEEDFCSELSGLSLKNIELSAEVGGKIVAKEFGEMLFTHFGVSGPVVLTISSYINRKINDGVRLCLDLKPALSEKQLDLRILRDFAEQKGKLLKNSLFKLLPKNLVPVVIEKSGLNGEKNTSVVTKEERAGLVKTLKRFELMVKGLAPLEQAIVTSGGVSVREINPKTMESKLVKGLRFAGEVIDVDALTGGFNLQIAFATGYLAGISN